MNEHDQRRGGAFWLAYQAYKRLDPGCSDQDAESYARRAWPRYAKCDRVSAAGLGRLFSDMQAGRQKMQRAG